MRIAETEERAEREVTELTVKVATEEVDRVASKRVEMEVEAEEKAEREAKQRAEREETERAEETARVRAEWAAKQKVEKEARELAVREAKERAEQEARAKAEMEAKEKAEREKRMSAPASKLPSRLRRPPGRSIARRRYPAGSNRSPVLSACQVRVPTYQVHRCSLWVGGWKLSGRESKVVCPHSLNLFAKKAASAVRTLISPGSEWLSPEECYLLIPVSDPHLRLQL